MKKLLFVLALGAFAACGNGTGDTDDDTTTILESDTTTIVPMTTDTTMMPMDTVHMDTVAH